MTDNPTPQLPAGARRADRVYMPGERIESRAAYEYGTPEWMNAAVFDRIFAQIEAIDIPDPRQQARERSREDVRRKRRELRQR